VFVTGTLNPFLSVFLFIRSIFVNIFFITVLLIVHRALSFAVFLIESLVQFLNNRGLHEVLIHILV
jgi:hypothetical protein